MTKTASLRGPVVPFSIEGQSRLEISSDNKLEKLLKSQGYEVIDERTDYELSDNKKETPIHQ